MSAIPYRAILALQAGVFLMMAGAGTLTTVVSVRLEEASVPSLTIGTVMAAYFAGTTLGSVYAFKVILRVGHIRAFATLLSLLSAATLGHALTGDVAIWGALRFIEGYCMAGLLICVESWLNHKAEAANRGKVLALYMICLYGGYGAGQLLLGLEGMEGFLLFAAVSILLSVALVPVAMTRQTPPELPRISAFGVRRLYATSPLGTLGAVVSGAVTGSLYTLGPVYVLRLGHDLSVTALFMTAAILGGVLLQWPLGWLSDLFDRRLVLVSLFGALLALSLILTVAVPGGLTGLMVAGLLLGGLVFVVYPLCVAQTNDHLSADQMISASGGLVLLYSLGATIGPFAASAIMGVLGAPGLMAFMAASSLLAAGFGLWRMRMRAPIPNADQLPFAAVARTTPVSVTLDPRAPE